MSKFVEFMSNYWWVFPIVASLIFYKWVFRLFGVIIVPEDQIGLVTKKFVLFGKDKSLPDGRIIATKGEAGFQAKTLAPGLYFGFWPWQYEISLVSFTVIPQGKIGLISAKDGMVPDNGAILGRNVDCDNFQDAEKFLVNNGQKGRQATILVAGSYRINRHLFDVSVCDQMHINDNAVGVVTTLDGLPLSDGQIAADTIKGHNKFQDFNAFLENGGQRGLQQEVILAGTYNINPWAVTIEEVKMTEIPIGYVGVVVSYVGEEGDDLTGIDFKHGNIVKKGQKGVWIEPLGPGKYPINPLTMRVELVPTTNLVLNWATGRNESHKLDAGLSTITVRSKDGFPFNLDVSQIIHVPSTEAPKVIARFGNMQNLVSQVLEPTIGNYFRNSAQDSDVIAFLKTRKERQDAAKARIAEVLTEYNVHAVDTLIGDITPPESLMKTLTDRKIAEEQQTTYDTQRMAQAKRQEYEKANAIADMQKDVVRSEQSVNIAQKDAEAAVKSAEGKATALKLNAQAEAESTKMKATAEAERISVTGKAEASKIEAIGKSTAEAYKLQVEAMGEDNFAKLKVTESIGINKIKVIPDVLIGGGANGGGGALEGMLGMQLMRMMEQTPSTQTEQNVVADTPVEVIPSEKKKK
jgi:uncharacterized membrane protein YqiK